MHILSSFLFSRHVLVASAVDLLVLETSQVELLKSLKFVYRYSCRIRFALPELIFSTFSSLTFSSFNYQDCPQLKTDHRLGKAGLLKKKREKEKKNPLPELKATAIINLIATTPPLP